MRTRKERRSSERNIRDIVESWQRRRDEAA
jgi:hypothetical protein